MREIKFRVWDKNIPKTQESTELKTPSGMMVDWEYVKKSSYLKDGIDGKYPIMQYTGLKDKNGIELYEGDIVRFYEDEILLVKWIEDESRFYCLSKYGLKNEMLVGAKLSKRSIKNIEVIGNIFENPELLEQK